MKTKLSPFLAGSFVIGLLVLVTLALVSIRSFHPFSQPPRFISYFKEPVQGLDEGSPVKLRGVRVGTIHTIGVQYDSKTRQSQVVVVAELDNNVMVDSSGNRIKISQIPAMERLIRDGLRAKIALAGITGQQFVELDFLDPQLYPAVAPQNPTRYQVIPTVPSGMSEITESLTKLIGGLGKVDFASLSREAGGLLDNANRQISGLDLKALSASVTAAADSIGHLAGSPEAGAAFASFNKTAADVQALVAKLDTQVDPVSRELTASLRSFHDAAEGVHKILGAQEGLGDGARKTLEQLTATAESLQRLADLLERNPSVLITGKKPPGKER